MMVIVTTIHGQVNAPTLRHVFEPLYAFAIGPIAGRIRMCGAGVIQKARPMTGRRTGGIDDADDIILAILCNQLVVHHGVHELHRHGESLAISEALAPAGTAATAVAIDDLNKLLRHGGLLLSVIDHAHVPQRV
jgi:hypothetical protein